MGDYKQYYVVIYIKVVEGPCFWFSYALSFTLAGQEQRGLEGFEKKNQKFDVSVIGM